MRRERKALSTRHVSYVSYVQMRITPGLRVYDIKRVRSTHRWSMVFATTIRNGPSVVLPSSSLISMDHYFFANQPASPFAFAFFSRSISSLSFFRVKIVANNLASLFSS